MKPLLHLRGRDGKIHQLSERRDPASIPARREWRLDSKASGGAAVAPPAPSDAGELVNKSAMPFMILPFAREKPINQGALADCWWLAHLDSLSRRCPAALWTLGKQTEQNRFVIRFWSNTFYRPAMYPTDVVTDAMLPISGIAGTGSKGSIWAEIFEKCAAYFLTGANTYASLNVNTPSQAMYMTGIYPTTFMAGAGGLVNMLRDRLRPFDQGGAASITAVTNPTVAGVVPLINAHVYSVEAFEAVGGRGFVMLRNPWGVDGAGADADPSDGVVIVSLLAFQTQFTSVTFGNEVRFPLDPSPPPPFKPPAISVGVP